MLNSAAPVNVVALSVGIRVFFRSRSDTALDILALRQQLAVMKRNGHGQN